MIASMNREIIKEPSIEERRKWGLLAHVSKEERERVLGLSHGKFKPEMKQLEREIKEAKYPKKKKSIVVEYRSFNPITQLPKEKENEITDAE